MNVERLFEIGAAPKTFAVAATIGKAGLGAGNATGCCGRLPEASKDLQILYGVDGERRLPEGEHGGCPVMAARPGARRQRGVGQFQLDVYGEVMDVLPLARGEGLRRAAWVAVQRLWSSSSSRTGDQPDDGIWEVPRPTPALHALQGDGLGGGRPRGARSRGFGLEGPVDRWRRAARRHPRPGLREGVRREARSFAQHYGRTELDASLLMIPLVGFLPPNDPRVMRYGRGGTARAGRTASCIRYPRRTAWTGCRPARVPSCPARSGWPTASR